MYKMIRNMISKNDDVSTDIKRSTWKMEIVKSALFYKFCVGTFMMLK